MKNEWKRILFQWICPLIVLFSVLAAGTAVLAGITGTGYVTVLAADNVEQN